MVPAVMTILISSMPALSQEDTSKVANRTSTTLIKTAALSRSQELPKNRSALDAILVRIDHGEKLPDSDVETLLSEVKLNPQDSTGHYVLGRYYESVNFGTLASQEYERAFSLNKARSQPLVALSRIRLRMADEPGAFEAITRAFKLFPHDYDVLVTAGLLLQRQGELQKAEFCYQSAMRIAPPDAQLLAARAQLLYKQNQFVEALGIADEALKLDPESMVAKAVKGKCLALAGNRSAALAPLADAYYKGPVNADLALILSDTASRLGKFEIALEPTLVSMPYAVGKPGKLLSLKKRAAGIILRLPGSAVDQKVEFAASKLKYSKNGNLLYFCLGDIYDRIGKKGEAIKCYEKGLQADPNYARGYLRLGEDQEDYLADYNSALQNYQKAIELSPNDDEVQLRFHRLSGRLPNYKKDIAWQIKTVLKQMNAKQNFVGKSGRA